jgi:hypothetical protein
VERVEYPGGAAAAAPKPDEVALLRIYRRIPLEKRGKALRKAEALRRRSTTSEEDG